MNTILRSDKLKHVHSDIRGPVYFEALRMQKEGIDVLRLNTGNPGVFNFKMPESVRQALVNHVDEAVAYCYCRMRVRQFAPIRSRRDFRILPRTIFLSETVSANW